MTDDRVTRQVVAVVRHLGQEVPVVARVFPDSKFLTVQHEGKVYLVKPTGRKDYPGFQGFEAWK